MEKKSGLSACCASRFTFLSLSNMGGLRARNRRLRPSPAHRPYKRWRPAISVLTHCQQNALLSICDGSNSGDNTGEQ